MLSLCPEASHIVSYEKKEGGYNKVFIFHLDNKKRIVARLQYSNTSWRDSAAAVRQEFVDLAKDWKDLGLEGQCPYSLTSEELTLQQREYGAFDRVQEIKSMLMNSLGVDSDGWVPAERWEEVKSAHKRIFNLALKPAREDQTGHRRKKD